MFENIKAKIGGSSHECTGKYGEIPSQSGGKTDGIELSCSADGVDDVHRFEGDLSQSEQKAEQFLKDNDLTARVVREK